jgi:hypothetical protein
MGRFFTNLLARKRASLTSPDSTLNRVQQAKLDADNRDGNMTNTRCAGSTHGLRAHQGESLLVHVAMMRAESATD